MNFFSISYAVLWLVVLSEVVLLLALARLVGRLTRQLPPTGARVIDPGPEIGEAVESWESVDLLGKAVSVRFPRERGIFLLYISPFCSVCAGLVPAAKRFFKEISEEAEGAWVMVLGTEQAQVNYAHEKRLTPWPVLSEKRLPEAWRLQGAPFAIWVDGGGRVRAKGMVNNRDHLESLRYAASTGHATVESYATEMAERLEKAD